MLDHSRESSADVGDECPSIGGVTSQARSNDHFEVGFELVERAASLHQEVPAVFTSAASFSLSYVRRDGQCGTNDLVRDCEMAPRDQSFRQSDHSHGQLDGRLPHIELTK